MFNATFLGEMLTFAVLIFVTMKYIWPPVIQAINERQQKIAEGLAAAARGQHDLELARGQAMHVMQQAKNEAQQLLERTGIQASTLLERSRSSAREEGELLIQLAKNDIANQKKAASQELQRYTAELVVALTKKLMQHDSTATNPTHMMEAIDHKLIEQLVSELKSE